MALSQLTRATSQGCALWGASNRRSCGCSAWLFLLHSVAGEATTSVLPGLWRRVTSCIHISWYLCPFFEYFVVLGPRSGFVQPSGALPFESPSRFSLTEPLFNRHFLSCIFFFCLRCYLQAFHLLIFWLSTALGVVFLELSVAMAKCSSHPCFSVDEPS